MRIWIILLVTMVLVAATSFAEVFVLNNGEEVEGTIARTSADGRVTIKMKSGVRTYRVTEFAEATRAKHFADLKVTMPKQRRNVRTSSAKVAGASLADPSEQKQLAGLIIAGIVLICIGGLWMTIAAFAESPIWGIAFLLSGGVAELAFMVLHWDRAKGPIATQVLGIGLLIAGVVLAS
ncbi:MAG: hypothetical protein HN919_00195 [Verrucomicrobia bacterium]|jgi:hypothetical protein|nr:hypothetical protein [Verrucomicrobiota bacterium]MBT7064697.1 hypothetical protein [Verrucomicrobiota bacterium]MBT7700181.1 hypothetical protein [Verrucomicrobiota bacterium]